MREIIRYMAYDGCVHWYRPGERWRAQITKDRKVTNLGYFADEVDAATAYNFAAFELHGEFARLNTPSMRSAT